MTIPAAAGYTWRYSGVQGLNHQYPDGDPDAEGIITAACGRVAMDFQVRTEADRHAVHCPQCLLRSPGAEIADRLEARSLKAAVELRREGPNL